MPLGESCQVSGHQSRRRVKLLCPALKSTTRDVTASGRKMMASSRGGSKGTTPTPCPHLWSTTTYRRHSSEEYMNISKKSIHIPIYVHDFFLAVPPFCLEAPPKILAQPSPEPARRETTTSEGVMSHPPRPEEERVAAVVTRPTQSAGRRPRESPPRLLTPHHTCLRSLQRAPRPLGAYWRVRQNATTA